MERPLKMGALINYGSILQFLIILILVISCTSQNVEPKEKISQNSQVKNPQPKKHSQSSPIGERRKDFVPGQILVKFQDDTNYPAIKTIQGELHLEVIRIVYKTNLYLMKILDGSSVENVIERLQDFKEVKYAEPNYIRTIE